MATALAPKEQRFVLDGVDWEFYETLLRRIGDRHIFITFDRGRLELMSPSWKHDTRSRQIAMQRKARLEESVNFRCPSRVQAPPGARGPRRGCRCVSQPGQARRRRGGPEADPGPRPL